MQFLFCFFSAVKDVSFSELTTVLCMLLGLYMIGLPKKFFNFEDFSGFRTLKLLNVVII